MFFRFIFWVITVVFEHCIGSESQSVYPSEREKENILRFGLTTLRAKIFICTTPSAYNLRKESPTLLEITCFFHCNKYGVRQKDLTFLCFPCKVPNFALTNLWSEHWIQSRAAFSALKCLGVLFSGKLGVLFSGKFIKNNQ